jgi:uncharacterized protein (DUF58 family)
MSLSRRFFLLAGLGLLLSLCGIFDYTFLYAGALSEVLLILFAIFDVLWIDFRMLKIKRLAPSSFTLMEPERVELSFLNSGPRDRVLSYRDLPPPAFQVRGHVGSVLCKAYSITRIVYRVTPVHRGTWQWHDLYVQVSGRLGLSSKRKRLQLAQDVRIYPRFRDRGPFAVSRQKRNYLAAKRYRQRGPGKEFESLRPYILGDDPRLIDWKASARRASIICRQYEVEKNQTLFLMIDCGRLMTTRIGDLGKLDYVLNSAASIAYLALDQGDFVGVFAFSHDIRFFVPPKKGFHHLRHLLEEFCMLQADPYEPDYQRTFAYFSTLQKKRALVAVYTDFLDQESSSNLIRNLQKISAHHIPLCLTIENNEIEEILAASSASPEMAAQKAVAWNFKTETEKVRDLLRSYGILTVHANHQDFTQASIDKYIEVKLRGAL